MMGEDSVKAQEDIFNYADVKEFYKEIALLGEINGVDVNQVKRLMESKGFDVDEAAPVHVYHSGDGLYDLMFSNPVSSRKQKSRSRVLDNYVVTGTLPESGVPVDLSISKELVRFHQLVPELVNTSGGDNYVPHIAVVGVVGGMHCQNNWGLRDRNGMYVKVPSVTLDDKVA
ncbi:hypothetical protein HQ545_00530 [Candidatus Woesearchaeota archaeon]|nr:hypothetical protein [Candidatus Woesearchaeota archaeon]